MKDNRLKEQVVKDIREALMEKREIKDCDAAVAPAESGDEDLSVLFAKNYTQKGGTMYYCYNEEDIGLRIKEIQKLYGDVTIGSASENLTGFLAHLDITGSETASLAKLYPLGAILCEVLMADEGSIVISSNQGLGSTLPALTEAVIVLAFTSQVVRDWEQANERLKEYYDEFPAQLIVTNPASYGYRSGAQKIFLILIEDEN